MVGWGMICVQAGRVRRQGNAGMQSVLLGPPCNVPMQVSLTHAVLLLPGTPAHTLITTCAVRPRTDPRQHPEPTPTPTPAHMRAVPVPYTPAPFIGTISITLPSGASCRLAMALAAVSSISSEARAGKDGTNCVKLSERRIKADSTWGEQQGCVGEALKQRPAGNGGQRREGRHGGRDF